MIDAAALHRAADLLYEEELDEELAVSKYGLPFEELATFVDSSTWSDLRPGGPPRELDSLALAIGVSIGVIAARRDQ